jgi:hypothetical protein
LAVHISNVHLDLGPVIAGHAERFGLAMTRLRSEGNRATETSTADWILLSRQSESLEIEAIQQAKLPPPDRKLYWTDQRNSVFQTLRTWR